MSILLLSVCPTDYFLIGGYCVKHMDKISGGAADFETACADQGDMHDIPTMRKDAYAYTTR